MKRGHSSAKGHRTNSRIKKTLYLTQVVYNRPFSVSLILSIVAILISVMSYRQSGRTFLLSNRPSVQMSESASESGGFKVALWNAGPGTAYDIVCEVHLAETIGNIGANWASEVLKAAIYFQEKTPATLKTNQHYGAEFMDTNPPSILQPGLKEAYFTTTVKHRVLQGLFLVIRYKDNQGNMYYSLWDGYHWVFDQGVCTALPVYKEHNQVALFYQRLLTRRDSDDFQSYLIGWLKDEAALLASKGDRTIQNEMILAETRADESEGRGKGARLKD